MRYWDQGASMSVEPYLLAQRAVKIFCEDCPAVMLGTIFQNPPKKAAPEGLEIHQSIRFRCPVCEKKTGVVLGEIVNKSDFFGNK